MHRTRQRVFCGDEHALTAARQRINDEFKDKKHVSDANSIAELIKHGEGVEEMARTQILQAQKKPDGTLGELCNEAFTTQFMAIEFYQSLQC